MSKVVSRPRTSVPARTMNAGSPLPMVKGTPGAGPNCVCVSRLKKLDAEDTALRSKSANGSVEKLARTDPSAMLNSGASRPWNVLSAAKR
jgi:hypothetical protein